MPTNRFALLPSVVAFALIVLIIVPQELLSAWLNRAGQFELDLRWLDYAGLILALVVVWMLARRGVTSARQSRVKSSISYCLPASAILLAVLFMNAIIKSIQYPKLYVFRMQYEECKKGAEKYSQRASFKICSARIHGNAYQIIAYDSEGQLQKKTDQQTEDFKNFIRRSVSPILSSCDLRTSRVSDAFYYIQADCG